MSVSELFNTGANYQWADIRVKSINFGGSTLDECEKNIQLTLSVSGALSGNVNAKVSKIGNICVLNIEPLTGVIVASNTINIGTLPVRYRPVESYSNTIAITNDGTRAVGLISIGASGNMTIHASVGQSNFSGTGVCGIPLMTSITYSTT